jgi:two-component system OmpR family sensor kinase
MSIRVRLTLWYTAVLAGILFIIGVAVFRLFTFSLDREINRTLEEAAVDLQGATPLEQPRVFANQHINFPRLDTFSSSTIYVQAWSIQGKLQAWSDNISGLPFPLDPQALEKKVSSWHFWDVPVESVEGPLYLRVLTIPLSVQDDNQLIGWLQVATSVQGIYNARKQLLTILVQGSFVGLLLSAFMGALLAQRALSPIDAITRTAVQITRADDLSRRISHLGPPDEVGRLAGAFNEMLERLECIFRAQQRFVADVSHELRTPLTTIRGNADLLRRMGGADAASLSAIQSETDRMIRLVGDLLLLARADAGHLPIAHKPVEIDAVLAEIAQQTRVLAGQRLQVELECPETEQEEPLIVLGDADRLKQLLLNLADNSVKHTPDGGCISLCLAQTDGLRRERSVERWVRVTVADTGMGIPPEDLPHIFDRFYRAEKSRWRKPTSNNASPGVGVGLGLSIARWIAETHGGRIEVQSEVGEGSAFHVWLPLAEQGQQTKDERKE